MILTIKKALAIAGIMALSITPTTSFADHIGYTVEMLRTGPEKGEGFVRKDYRHADLNKAYMKKIDLRNTVLN